MKSLKRVLAALALAFFANFSMAQNTDHKATPEQKAQRQTERLTEQLSLTTDQQAKVKEINLAAVSKNESARNDKSLSEEAKKQSFKRNEDARKQMIKALLTPEQLKKFEENESQRTEKKQNFPKDAKKLETGERKTAN